MPEESTPPPHHSQHHWPGQLTGAFILVFLGIIFLLNNFGILPWGIWGTLWRFWPVFLILWGLQAIFGRSWISSVITSVLSLIILSGVLAYALAISNPRVNNWVGQVFPGVADITSSNTEMTSYQKIIPGTDYPNVKTREVSLQSGVSRLSLTDESSTDLFKLDAAIPKNSNSPIVNPRNFVLDTLKVDFQANEGSGWWPWAVDRHYDVTLGNPVLPTSVKINVGTAQTTVNLRNVPITEFSLDTGTGASTLTFNETTVPTGKFRVHSGTGAVTIKLPKSVGLKVNYDLGVGKLSIDGTTVRGDGTYSVDFDNALKRVELSVDAGTGAVTIIRD